jgi:hypothetical protein
MNDPVINLLAELQELEDAASEGYETLEELLAKEPAARDARMKLWERICETPPQTIAGAVAQLELLLDHERDESAQMLIRSVIAGLRALTE